MPKTNPEQFPTIYRAIAKRSWYDAESKRVLSAAFILRSQDKGISILKAVDCSREDCLAGLNTCFGEFALETARVVALGLEVVDDEPNAEDFSDNHAEIIGIPVGRETHEEVKAAEDFASELAELSTLHYDREDKYA